MDKLKAHLKRNKDRYIAAIAGGLFVAYFTTKKKDDNPIVWTRDATVYDDPSQIVNGQIVARVTPDQMMAHANMMASEINRLKELA